MLSTPVSAVHPLNRGNQSVALFFLLGAASRSKTSSGGLEENCRPFDSLWHSGIYGLGATRSSGTEPDAQTLQGYVAHKKQPPPRTLKWAYAQGPTVALGGGKFLMSEVPL